LKYSLLAFASLLFLNSSCSWYKDLERSLVADDEKKQQRSRHVSREQYDQLLVKYEELSKKYEQVKENPNAGKPSLVDDLQKTQGENFANTTKPNPNGETETVNVFTGEQKADAQSVSNSEIPQELEGQLSLYRRGLAIKASNPGEATKIFQQLESSTTPPVRVRSKLQVGELLLSQQQYDLALQVFEDIISKDANSGAVIDALRYAVVCSEKLGIQNKKDQYSTMLNDVFETR